MDSTIRDNSAQPAPPRLILKYTLGAVQRVRFFSVFLYRDIIWHILKWCTLKLILNFTSFTGFKCFRFLWCFLFIIKFYFALGRNLSVQGSKRGCQLHGICRREVPGRVGAAERCGHRRAHFCGHWREPLDLSGGWPTLSHMIISDRAEIERKKGWDRERDRVRGFRMKIWSKRRKVNVGRIKRVYLSNVCTNVYVCV